MARTFRRRQTAAPISELNITNMVDLGFTLLVIFMIATPLIQKEQTIPVNLPSESKSPQQKPDRDQRALSRSRSIHLANYYLDNSTTAVPYAELKVKPARLSPAEPKPPGHAHSRRRQAAVREDHPAHGRAGSGTIC